MSSKISIFLLDKSKNIIEDITIPKPKSYEDLIKSIKKNIKKLYTKFTIFYKTMNDKEIKIDNNEIYKTTQDIIFIKEKENPDDENLTMFSYNYNKLPESKQEILDEKFNCYICSINIKNENPFFCYECQKNFHEKCLKDWQKKRSEANEPLNCPNCRNVLKLNDWKRKLDFKDNRKNEAEIMNKINKLEENKNINNNLNLINTNKIKKLEDENKNIINEHKKFLEKVAKLLKEILTKLNEINSVYNKNKINKNTELLNLIEEITKKNIKSKFDNISNVILKEFETIIQQL